MAGWDTFPPETRLQFLNAAFTSTSAFAMNSLKNFNKNLKFEKNIGRTWKCRNFV